MAGLKSSRMVADAASPVAKGPATQPTPRKSSPTLPLPAPARARSAACRSNMKTVFASRVRRMSRAQSARVSVATEVANSALVPGCSASALVVASKRISSSRLYATKLSGSRCISPRKASSLTAPVCQLVMPMAMVRTTPMMKSMAMKTRAAEESGLDSRLDAIAGRVASSVDAWRFARFFWLALRRGSEGRLNRGASLRCRWDRPRRTCSCGAAASNRGRRA